MCIGLPLQVTEVDGAVAQAQGPEGAERVDIRLVAGVQPGQWVLVLHGAAREIISAERAAEVQSALDLLAQALSGTAVFDPTADPGFALPSSMPAADLDVLTGRSREPGA